MKKKTRPAKSAKSTTLTLAQAATRYGVDERTVRRWVAAGAPVVRRGRRGSQGPVLDGEKFDAWADEQSAAAETLGEALLKKFDAQSRSTRRKAEEIMSSHLPRVYADAAWAIYTASVRDRVKKIPRVLARKISASVDAGGNGNDVAALIELYVHDLLVELSNTDLPELPAPPRELVPDVSSSSPSLVAARTRLANLQAIHLDLVGECPPRGGRIG